MMISKDTLVLVADRFRLVAGGLAETTLSHRMFGDTKKIASLRAGSDITVGRFNAAMRWMAENWPEGEPLPRELLAYRKAQDEDAA